MPRNKTQHRTSGFKPFPADVIGAARVLRQDRFMRQPLADIEARNDERLTPVIAELAEATSIPDDQPPRFRRPAHDGPRWVACPWCKVGPGQPCYNTATRRPFRGHHPARIEAAQAANADQTSRRRKVSVAVAERRCGCGRPIFDGNLTCDDCYRAVRYGPQHTTNGDRGTA